MFNPQPGEPRMETQTERERFFTYTQSEVENLLRMYEEYKNLEKRIASRDVQISEQEKLEHAGAAPKFSFAARHGKMTNYDPLARLKEEKLEAMKLELKALGEAMKFQNPLIWLRYKREAYKDEPTTSANPPIRTVEDLVRHCDTDGICHRRFDAINLYLRRKHQGKDVKSTSFIDSAASLHDLEQDPRFIAMSLDPEFAEVWSGHENSSAGKWREYALSSPDHDCEINCTC